jgi:hypothetical protein
VSTIPPHIAITYQPKTQYEPLKRDTPPATEEFSASHPTYADRLALAMCKFGGECKAACPWCREASAKATQELATILRERHGSSSVADWLDGIPSQ